MSGAVRTTLVASTMLALCSLSGLARTSAAATLPVATASLSTSSGSDGTAPAQSSSDNIYGNITSTTLYASATASSDPDIPAAYAASSAGFANAGAIAKSTLQYSFEVNTPFPVIVPVDISYQLDVGGSGNDGNSSAEFSLGYVPDLSYGVAYYDSVYYSPDMSEPAIDLYRQTVNYLTSDNVYYVSLITQAATTTNALRGGASSSYAFADPNITIDSSYLLLNKQTSLTFSAGIGNSVEPFVPASAAPEPKAWMLLLLGVFLLGLCLRGSNLTDAPVVS
jgi:hypothetical protein